MRPRLRRRYALPAPACALLALASFVSGCSSESTPAGGAKPAEVTTSGGASGGANSSTNGGASGTTGGEGAGGPTSGSGVTDTAGNVVSTASSEATSSGGSGGTPSTTAGAGGLATTSVGGTTAATGEAGSSSTESATAGGVGGSGGTTESSDQIVLFDGTSFEEWRPLAGDGDVPWELPGDGTMVVVPETGNIVTRRTFEDLFVHVEYKTPMLPASVTGQDRGNSGVYLNSMYELQVLDSFGLAPAIDGCGAIYEVSAPSSTACYEQEVWNTYEIEFQVAQFDSQGEKQSDARVVSATLNGVLVQENVDVPDSTKSGQPEMPGPGPLMLQDHLNPVAFRNIWVIPR